MGRSAGWAHAWRIGSVRAPEVASRASRCRWWAARECTDITIIILILLYFRSAGCSGCKDVSGIRLYFSVVIGQGNLRRIGAAEVGRLHCPLDLLSVSAPLLDW